MNAQKIKVLVADDSLVTRQLLVHLLSSDPRIQVVGSVKDGQAALDYVSQGSSPKPDVVLMDIHMPRLDGFEATRQIMETHPLPIVICTATADPRELAIAFRSMEAGAVACVEKPGGTLADDPRATHLIQTICLMSEVKVVRRWRRNRDTASTGTHRVLASPCNGAPVVGIGASTGGPPVLQTILSDLPKGFGAPILIVQHITPGFLSGMVDWLNQTTGLTVHIASHGLLPLAGHAYIAPDDFHLGMDNSGHLVLSRGLPERGLRPAVSWLFRSLADSCGTRAIGVLLTGMGKDGAAELTRMKEAGCYTIAQDRESSVVHGMPGEAIAMGGASIVLPADRIAPALVSELQRRTASVGETSP